LGKKFKCFFKKTDAASEARNIYKVPKFPGISGVLPYGQIHIIPLLPHTIGMGKKGDTAVC
jgi:hypothetical protein